MSTSVLIVLGLVALAVIGFVVWKKNQDTEVSTPTATTNPVNEGERKVQGILNGLLALNIEARDNALPGAVITAVEKVIDNVRAIAEDVNKPEKYSEMTVSVNRMHSKYIPSLLTPYIALDAEGREKYADQMVEKLETLSGELTSIKQELDSDDFSEFEKRSRFIAGMFEKADAEDIFN